MNGKLIHSKEQLHSALRQNSAFCKLEVQNHQGESKFLQRAIYAGIIISWELSWRLTREMA